MVEFVPERNPGLRHAIDLILDEARHDGITAGEILGVVTALYVEALARATVDCPEQADVLMATLTPGVDLWRSALKLDGLLAARRAGQR